MLKHLGRANFDDNRSAEFSEAILPFSAVWDDIRMKYGFSLDKKLHGSYQIVYQGKMAIPTNAEFVGCLWATGKHGKAGTETETETETGTGRDAQNGGQYF